MHAYKNLFIFVFLKDDDMQQDSSSISNPTAQHLSTKELNGKTLYFLKRQDREAHAAMDALCKELKSVCPSQQMNRRRIHEQLVKELDSDYQGGLIRLDVKSCFEHIPYQRVIAILRRKAALSEQAYERLEMFQQDYRQLSDGGTAIPRGLASTMLLAGIYLETLDEELLRLPGVRVSIRYVDDNIITFDRTQAGMTAQQMFQKIKEVYNHFDLEIHDPDVFPYKGDIFEDKNHCDFPFLGWNISKSSDKEPSQWTLGEDVTMHYMYVVKFYVDHFLERLAKPEESEKSPLAELLSGLRIATSCRRIKKKGYAVHCGLRFSFPYLTSTAQLEWMDQFREKQLQRITPDRIPDGFMGAGKWFSKEETARFIVRRCSKYTFLKGYKEKRFA